MKKAKKVFISLLCILLSVLVASATLMVGATDDEASQEATSVTYTLVPSTAVVTTTQKEITDIISEIVSKNELKDDLSEVGSEVVDFSEKTSTFFSKIIEAIEKFSENFLAFFKQIFKIADFD